MADGSALGFVRRPEPLKAFDGVGYGQRATARVVGGKQIHAIYIVASAAIDRAELLLGNDWIVNLSAANLTLIRRVRKLWEENYYYVLSLSDPKMATFKSEVLSGFNTTADMDITLAVTFGAGVGTPTLRAFAVQSDYDLRDPNALFRPRLRELQMKGGSAGDLELDSVHLRKDGTEWIRAVHFYGGASDNITKLTVVKDDKKLCEITRDDMRFLLKESEWAPQADYFHFIPPMAGFAEEMLNTGHLRHLKFIVTLDGTLASIPAVIETVEQLPAPSGG